MAAESPRGGEVQGGKGSDPYQEIARYSEMLAQDPRSRAFALLAEAHRKAGQHDEAVRVAQEGLKHHPFYLSGRVALARAYFEKGEIAAARLEFEKVTTSAPDNLMAHRHLAEIYISEGKLPEAAKSLRMVILLDPADERAKERLREIGADTRSAGSLGATEGVEMVMEDHRYGQVDVAAGAPASAAPGPEFRPMTDQEMIHQPELSARDAPMEVPPPEMPPEEAPAVEELAFPVELEEPAIEPITMAEEFPPEATVAVEEIPTTPPVPENPAPDFRALEEAADESETWGDVMQDVQPAEEEPGELDTQTLADIYIQQGFYEKSLDIYQKLLAAQPQEARLRQKCEEIKSLIRMSGLGAPKEAASRAGDVSGEKPIDAQPPPAEAPSVENEALATLRQWLDRIKMEPK